ncbi:MAG TPA: hypothetical protein VK576_06995 [Thermoleophilia bacterium]|nr:hypothetical protein [Thermoleophilia bacterium]
MKGWTDDGWGGDRWEHGEQKAIVAHTPLLSYLSIPLVRSRRRRSSDPAVDRGATPRDKR